METISYISYFIIIVLKKKYFFFFFFSLFLGVCVKCKCANSVDFTEQEKKSKEKEKINIKRGAHNLKATHSKIDNFFLLMNSSSSFFFNSSVFQSHTSSLHFMIREKIIEQRKRLCRGEDDEYSFFC